MVPNSRRIRPIVIESVGRTASGECRYSIWITSPWPPNSSRHAREETRAIAPARRVKTRMDLRAVGTSRKTAAGHWCCAAFVRSRSQPQSKFGRASYTHYTVYAAVHAPPRPPPARPRPAAIVLKSVHADSGGSRARGRARARAAQSTWAHRVRTREMVGLEM